MTSLHDLVAWGTAGEPTSHLQNRRFGARSQWSSGARDLKAKRLVELEYAEMALRHPQRHLLLTRSAQERERADNEGMAGSAPTKIRMNPHGREKGRFVRNSVTGDDHADGTVAEEGEIRSAIGRLWSS